MTTTGGGAGPDSAGLGWLGEILFPLAVLGGGAVVVATALWFVSQPRQARDASREAAATQARYAGEAHRLRSRLGTAEGPPPGPVPPRPED